LNDLARVHLMNELLLLLLIRLERIIKIRLIVDLRPCNQANLETHRSHDLYMSQNTISSEVNKGICEAFGCFAEAKWHLTENSSYEQISTAKRD
jgi:hypothetical protein